MNQTQLEEQLNELYRLCSLEDEQSMAVVQMVIDLIEGCFAARDTQTVNDYLGALDVKRASPSALTCSLRSAYRARSLLPNWHLLLDATYTELVAKGLNAKRMLRGMV